MANILQAIQAYGPHIEPNVTIKTDVYAEWMSMRTGLNKSAIIMVLQELNEAILFFNRQGTPVYVTGIGTFSPSVDRHGQIKINLRPDVKLKKGINRPDLFSGRMVNKKHVGLSDEEYKQLWDSDHPDDPLEI